MANLTRKDLHARYQLFDDFALDDQRVYYQRTLKRYRLAASQVNRIRALMALFTGIAAAVAGLIVQSSFVDGTQCNPVDTAAALPAECSTLSGLVLFFTILSIVLPALGAFFNSLADLFQWDRMTTIYDTALENIEVADALSPLPEMEDDVYRASFVAYAEGTLLVMRDETSQWGQSIRTPAQVDKFLEQEREKAARLGGTIEQQQFGGPQGTGSPPPPPAPAG